MEKHIFGTMKKGYNRYQVDDYVQKQEIQIHALQTKLDALTKELEDVYLEKKKIEDQYSKLSENLQIKERAAGDMARIAMKESNMIVDTANQNADLIVKEALLMARGILMEIARLGNEANDLKSSMKEELHRIEEALDDFETPEIPNMNLLHKTK